MSKQEPPDDEEPLKRILSESHRRQSNGEVRPGETDTEDEDG